MHSYRNPYMILYFRHIARQTSITSPPNKSSPTIENFNITPDYNCHIYSKKLPPKGTLKLHDETFTQVQNSLDVHECNNCGEIIYEEHTKLNEHICGNAKLFKTSANCFFKCEFCESFFTNKSSLVDHKSKMHLNKLFECNVCDVKFSNYFR